jgi:hypothetical protein
MILPTLDDYDRRDGQSHPLPSRVREIFEEVESELHEEIEEYWEEYDHDLGQDYYED